MKLELPPPLIGVPQISLLLWAAVMACEVEVTLKVDPDEEIPPLKNVYGITSPSLHPSLMLTTSCSLLSFNFLDEMGSIFLPPAFWTDFSFQGVGDIYEDVFQDTSFPELLKPGHPGATFRFRVWVEHFAWQ